MVIADLGTAAALSRLAQTDGIVTHQNIALDANYWTSSNSDILSPVVPV